MGGEMSGQEKLRLSSLPDDVLETILVCVPAKDLVKSCCLVNKQWKSIIDGQKLWREKCEKIGIYSSQFPVHPKDFKKYYFTRPYSRNLIKNCAAKDSYEHWNVENDGGDGFQLEQRPIGSHPVENYADIKGLGLEPPISCWSTSYGWCSKSQMIDLVEEGCDEEVLDKVPITVQISDWFSARVDCKVIYKLKVKFLDQEKQKLDKLFVEEQLPAGREWKEVSLSVPLIKGTRYIDFHHYGKDEQFWAGHYGAKFTLSTVKLVLSKKIMTKK